MITNQGDLQLGGTGGTYLGGNPIYVGQSGTNVYIRGAVSFSSADSVSGITFSDIDASSVDASRYYLGGSSVISSSGGYNYFGTSSGSNVVQGSSINIGTTGTDSSTVSGSSVNVGTSRSVSVSLRASPNARIYTWAGWPQTHQPFRSEDTGPILQGAPGGILP